MTLRTICGTGGAVAVLCVVVAASAADSGSIDSQNLPDWLRIAGIECAGKNIAQMRKDLRTWADGQHGRGFILIAAPDGERRRMWNTRRSSLGAALDIEGMLNEAARIARSEGWLARVGRLFGRGEIEDVKPVWTVDTPRLERYLKYNVAPILARPPRPARLVLQSGAPKIIDGLAGRGIDPKTSLATVRDALRDHEATSAIVTLSEIPPPVTSADAAGIVDEIASFKTHYNERGNRKRNLEIACRRINGTILKPGDVFSYNDIVGPRDAENGFKMAPVIVRGRMEPGMGGGVCQVSTTVYNAGLLAGLDVVRRQHHAFPVHYVPPGRDATVVYGAIDLKLRNSGDTAVGLIADGSNGWVSVRVFGKRIPGRTITIERTGVSSWGAPRKTVKSPDLPAGKTVVVDAGRSGHRVTVWRVVRQNGKLVSRTQLSRDVYSSFPRIVSVGTGQRQAPKPPASAGVGSGSPVPLSTGPTSTSN